MRARANTSRSGLTERAIGVKTKNLARVQRIPCFCILNWSRWSDLNRRPLDYESSALPLSYTGTLGYFSG